MQEELKKKYIYNDGDLLYRNGKYANKPVRKSLVNGRYYFAKIEKKYVPLHRLIYIYHFGEYKKSLEVDHIDGDKFNNRIENLRIVTHKQNMMNRLPNNKRLGVQCASKYRGVFRSSKVDRWRARLVSDEIRYNIGTFDTEIEAAVAYNQVASKMFGKYARLNLV